MKINTPSVSLLLSALYFKVVSAQLVSIGYPPNGTSVAAGSNLLVEIDRPNTASSSIEVAVVIGLKSCPTDSEPCYPDGSPLYNGKYNPTDLEGYSMKPPHQNFTVTIPADTPPGKVQLGVAHFMLLGASMSPDIQTLSIDLNIVSPKVTRFDSSWRKQARRSRYLPLH